MKLLNKIWINSVHGLVVAIATVSNANDNSLCI